MPQYILKSPLRRGIYIRNTPALGPIVGKFFLMFTMTLLIGILSFSYLVKFTEIHTKGYQLRKLEMQRDSLMTSRETQNMEIAKEKSLVSVKENAVSMNMIPARNIVFVQKQGAVAQLPEGRH